MKTGLQIRPRATQRDRVAPDTGPMTGSSNYQQPSTIRGEAHDNKRTGHHLDPHPVDLFVEFAQALFEQSPGVTAWAGTAVADLQQLFDLGEA